MTMLLITNNTMVRLEYTTLCEVIFLDTGLKEVLLATRDLVHKGHKLLTHPLSGSVKPNETPYKSILLSKEQGVLDLDSLSMIEGALMTCDKFGENIYRLDEQLKNDFSTIDLSLISGAFTTVTGGA